MRSLRFLLLLMIIPALFQISCKKDEDKSETLTYKEPVAASRSEVVTIPASLQEKAQSNTDIGATIAVSYMGLVNAISSYSNSFVIPEGAKVQGKKSGSVVYFWTNGGYSFWMTYTELVDKNTWTYDWEIPGAARFTYIEAEEAKNGKSGNWTIFNPDATSDYVWTYDWSVNATNTYSASLQWKDNDELSSFDVIANADNSGSFKYYVSSVLVSDINWNADGSGTYWISSDGVNVIQGSWTAK
jgi:hypothetical protein